MEVCLSPAQMAAAEQFAVTRGISLETLMDNAGYALAGFVKNVCYRGMLRAVVLLCGKGNNGGDGLVCAQYLAAQYGIRPRVVLTHGAPSSAPAAQALEKLRNAAPYIEIFDATAAGFSFAQALRGAQVLVDALFGTGFHGTPDAVTQEALDAFSRSNAVKIACDAPSGLDCLTGKPAQHTPVCEYTVTFHAPKIGMLLPAGRIVCGKITTVDIGIPEIPNHAAKISVVSSRAAASFLPPRPVDGHKGTFGTAVLICGSARYTGAAAIACEAALRSGAGLVKLVTTTETAAAVRVRCPEAIVTAFEADADGSIPAAKTDEIVSLCENADAVLAGCGMGNTASTAAICAALLKRLACPLILDADGITSLVPHIYVLDSTKAAVLLTPHPGELARLAGQARADEAARLDCAREIALAHRCTVLAKGAGSFIAGQARTLFSAAGNTAQSKGASGDLLAGLLCGIAAQTARAGVFSPEGACALAAFLVGDAAQRLTERRSPRGVTAGDLLQLLPESFAALETL
ncbi:MAG: NAD(P)H-hydrate dehydratase [Oscillospiraceae bacterium]